MKNTQVVEAIKPHKLKMGDTIGVIAPADPVRGVCPEDVIERGYEYLRQKGFNIIEGQSVKEFSKSHTAGSVDMRVKDINDFLNNDVVTCIMAFWGGFNTNQILERIDYELVKEKRKVFIGYSDVTALTTAITTKTGLITFSGPGVISYAKPEPFDYTWSYFEKMCISGEGVKLVPSLEFADDMYFLREDDDHRILKVNDGLKVYRAGQTDGQVVAGNLQTLLLLNDTEFLEGLDNKILFIEEDETSTPAHVDRYFAQMKQLGWLDKIRGLVIGRFTEHSQFSPEDTFEVILNQYLSNVTYPVLYNADFGHSDPMATIPNGGLCKIVGPDIYFESAVE